MIKNVRLGALEDYVLCFSSIHNIKCDWAFYGQVLATICEELPPDGVLLIYLSASGYINSFYFSTHGFHFSVYLECKAMRCSCLLCRSNCFRRAGLTISSPSGAGTFTDTTGNASRNFQSHTIYSDATSGPQCDVLDPSSRQSQGDCLQHHSGCLQFGTRGSGGTFSDIFDELSILYHWLWCIL